MARFSRSLATALSIACLAPLAIVAAPSAAFAQTQPPGAPEEPLKQVALSEAQVQAYLAAEAEIEPIMAKLPENATAKPDPKVMAQLDAIAKKYKFASYDEFDDIGANIGLVSDGVDPQTKKYVGADVLLKKQIADVQADKKMSAADKKEALEELNDALKSVEPVQFPGNIDLVVKYYDKIVAAMPQSPDK
ncbi:MAG: hypothetical protein ABR878_17535 [Roseiarcus sp.]|jgi:hypothetical protein